MKKGGPSDWSDAGSTDAGIELQPIPAFHFVITFVKMLRSSQIDSTTIANAG